MDTYFSLGKIKRDNKCQSCLFAVSPFWAITDFFGGQSLLLLTVFLGNHLLLLMFLLPALVFF